MKIAVVKYNAGNTASVINALERLGIDPVISADPEVLRSADKVIFPGVGEASSAMRYLREARLDGVLKSLAQPVLGVCLGMQLLCSASDENDTECLSLLPYQVRRFAPVGRKVPHMGWNTIGGLRGPLFDGVPENSHVYFVHGYYIESGEHTTAESTYGTNFSAAITVGNFHAVQFHTEKSGVVGERILKNFVTL